jgi:hypothetical protein
MIECLKTKKWHPNTAKGIPTIAAWKKSNVYNDLCVGKYDPEDGWDYEQYMIQSPVFARLLFEFTNLDVKHWQLPNKENYHLNPEEVY